MTSLIHNRLTHIWALLSALTLLSWWSGTRSEAGAAYEVNLTITISVLALALIKSRLVISQFMEVGEAPRWLRYTCDSWLVFVFGMIFAFYWFGL